MNREEILRNIKEKIKSINPEARVVLYGSRARGTARENSDWDILILLPHSGVSLQEESLYRDALYPLSLAYETSFSVLALSQERWQKQYAPSPLYKNIQKEGIIL